MLTTKNPQKTISIIFSLWSQSPDSGPWISWWLIRLEGYVCSMQRFPQTLYQVLKVIISMGIMCWSKNALNMQQLNQAKIKNHNDQLEHNQTNHGTQTRRLYHRDKKTSLYCLLVILPVISECTESCFCAYNPCTLSETSPSHQVAIQTG